MSRRLFFFCLKQMLVFRVNGHISLRVRPRRLRDCNYCDCVLKDKEKEIEEGEAGKRLATDDLPQTLVVERHSPIQ